ncbi:MAG: terminase family protein [Nitrospiraceae bacterium]
MEFSPHLYQQMVLDAEPRFVLAVGGVQSGKTTIGMVQLLLWLQEDLSAGIAGHYLIAVPSYKTWIQSTKVKFYEMFPKDWGDGPNFGWHEKDSYFKTIWGAHIYVRSTNDPNAIEGMTLNGAWLDEFGQMEEAVWNHIQARVGAKKGRVVMTTTPYLGKFWVKNLVYDRAVMVNGERRCQCHVTPDDACPLDHEVAVVEWATAANPGFDKKEIERQRKQMSKEMFELRYQGKFSAPHGIVYREFDRDEDVVAPFPIPDNWRKFGGIDFGFGSTTAVICIAEKPAELDQNGKPKGLPTFYVYREFYESKAELRKVAAFIEIQDMISLLGDPRGAQEMAELTRAYGVRHLTKADNSIENGIERIKALVQDHRLKIFKTCKNTLDELFSYHYKLETEDKDSDGLPAKVHDHAMDALRYAFSREFNKIYKANQKSVRYQLAKTLRPVARRSTMGTPDKFTGY